MLMIAPTIIKFIIEVGLHCINIISTEEKEREDMPTQEVISIVFIVQK